MMDRIKNVVKETYGQIASVDQPLGCGCGCGCGDDGAKLYSVFKDDYEGIAGYVRDADLNLGCGLPTEFASIKVGDTVIDLGSGAGNDCFVARKIVGENGLVIGIDMTPEMIERAQANNTKLGYANVKFRLGDIENLPVTANKADVIISNCVINLVPDKYMAFNEMMRVLKPGGHFCISDVVTEGDIPPELLEKAELYAGCVAGAVPANEYLDLITKTGFKKVVVQKMKFINLPDELLATILAPDEAERFRSSQVGLFTITITGEKPSCLCSGAC